MCGNKVKNLYWEEGALIIETNDGQITRYMGAYIKDFDFTGKTIVGRKLMSKPGSKIIETAIILSAKANEELCCHCELPSYNLALTTGCKAKIKDKNSLFKRIKQQLKEISEELKKE